MWHLTYKYSFVSLACQLRQAYKLAQEVPATYLEKSLYMYKAKNPGSSLEDAMKHIMKWKVSEVPDELVAISVIATYLSCMKQNHMLSHMTLHMCRCHPH